MMQMDHRLLRTKSQRLMLTQKMQQALQVLQLSGLELEQYVQQELETNPLLEQIKKDPLPETNGAHETPEGHDNTVVDDVAFDLDGYAGDWDRKYREGRDFSVNREAADRRDYFQNSITKGESLTAHLIAQLRLSVQDESELQLGEYIIGEINERGYFQGSLEEIALELEIPFDKANRMLYRIQAFEPTGVCARDPAECLLLQIRVEFPDNPELKELVSNHLEDLQQRRIPKIAKKMRIEPERVEELKELLATLNPWPGLEYESEPTQYIAADLVVEKDGNCFTVSLTNESVPALRVNGMYKEISKDRAIAREDRSFVRDKMESAKWLIRNIEQRQQTILRIGMAIMEVQEDFLRHGVQKIRPLTLQEIAGKVGVHEATVSRATRGKYVQTPQGLFELKYFFSPGLQRASGESQSSKSVQSVIRDIIDEEDKAKPLSDQKIANKLSEQGLKIARRTVTKYREALTIPATTMRKQY